jgi:hypothetical protein
MIEARGIIIPPYVWLLAGWLTSPTVGTKILPRSFSDTRKPTVMQRCEYGSGMSDISIQPSLSRLASTHSIISNAYGRPAQANPSCRGGVARGFAIVAATYRKIGAAANRILPAA